MPYLFQNPSEAVEQFMQEINIPLANKQQQNYVRAVFLSGALWGNLKYLRDIEDR